MPAEQSQESFKYWAFISYSHADERWADWLHRALETYRVPKRLVGKPSREGIVPVRPFPVFRDRDELPGSANLTENIKVALRQSRYLVVLCSPRAAASSWVNQEVKMFKALGREDRVLCLIIDGEPNVSDKPGQAHLECFPESVRFWVDPDMRITEIPTEPIAADARKGKDGKYNALLKLLAGILGVSFDDLKQRDHERQERRKKVVVAVSLSLAIAFGFLTLELYKQKNEALTAKNVAEIERTQAEAAKLVALRAKEDAEIARRQAEEAEQLERRAKDEQTRAAEMAKKARDEADQEREAAEAARNEAIAAQKAAQESELKAKRSEEHIRSALAASDLTTAMRLIGEQEPDKALAYLSRALRYDPQNSAIVVRTLSLLMQRNWPVPLFEPLKHHSEVKSAQFSPDGKWVLSISENAARIWNGQTGRQVTAPLTHSEPLSDGCFSPDGTLLVTASRDGTAQVWRVPSGEKVGEAIRHKLWINAVVFSPQGRFIATASQDRTVRIWNAASGEAVTPPLAHEGPVTVVQFSPDGKWLATGFQTTVRVWEVATGQPWLFPLRHEGGVSAIAFTPDSKALLTAAGDGAAHAARVWEIATLDPLLRIEHAGWINSVAFGAGGQQILTASSDRTAQLWDITGKKLMTFRHEHDVKSAVFSPNGLWVATASGDGTARIWDAETGSRISESLHHLGPVNTAKFSPDGRFVVTAAHDRTAKVWQVANGKPIFNPLAHEHWVNAVAFSADGSRVATASNDRTASVWDPATGKPVSEPLRHKGQVLCLAMTPDREFLITGSQDWNAYVWHLPSGKLRYQPLQHSGRLNALDISPDGKWFVTAAEDRTARVFEVSSGNIISRLRHEGAVLSASFNSDSSRVVTAARDKTARVWDAMTGNLICAVGHPGGEMIRAAALSPDGEWLATTADDKTTRIWDVNTGAMLAGPLAHEFPADIITFTPASIWRSGKWLLTAADKSARIWDAETGRPITERLRHSDVITAAQFSPDGTLFLTASGRSAFIWDARTGKPVSDPLPHEGKIQAAAFSPDGTFIATASQDQSAKVWMVAPRGEPTLWLSTVADAIGGYYLDHYGAAQPLPDPWSKFSEVRSQIKQAPHDFYAHWTQWYLAERSSRKISPVSLTSVAEYVDERVEQGTVAALKEALELQPNHGLALAKLARLVSDPIRADALSGLAETYEPENPQVLWLRAAVLQQLGRAPEAFVVMTRAISRDPNSTIGFGPDGIEIAAVNRDGHMSKGWLPLGWLDRNSSRALTVNYAKVEDAPKPDLTALAISVTSSNRLQAQLQGPRFIARRNTKCTIEGWIRGEGKSEISLAIQQFLAPHQKYFSENVSVTDKWKPFRIQFTPTQDIAADLLLLQPAGSTVAIAGVTVRTESARRAGTN